MAWTTLIPSHWLFQEPNPPKHKAGAVHLRDFKNQGGEAHHLGNPPRGGQTFRMSWDLSISICALLTFAPPTYNFPNRCQKFNSHRQISCVCIQKDRETFIGGFTHRHQRYFRSFRWSLPGTPAGTTKAVVGWCDWGSTAPALRQRQRGKVGGGCSWQPVPSESTMPTFSRREHVTIRSLLVTWQVGHNLWSLACSSGSLFVWEVIIPSPPCAPELAYTGLRRWFCA